MNFLRNLKQIKVSNNIHQTNLSFWISIVLIIISLHNLLHSISPLNMWKIMLSSLGLCMFTGFGLVYLIKIRKHQKNSSGL